MVKLASWLLVLSTGAALGVAASSSQPSDANLLKRALALHKQVPLIDGHNDYPWALRESGARDLDKLDITQSQPALHTDIARLRAGGVGGQFWSVYVPAALAGQGAVTATLEQIDIVHRMMRKYPDVFELALTADDVERIFRKGKIASLIGMEGGHSIDSSLGALRMLHRMGARYMTLTHSRNVPWADSGTDEPKLGGLSAFGEVVVREMNWLGMLVDLSHTSPETMGDAIRVTQAPVIFSHSSARAVADVPRNVPDDILKVLPENGGVVMVTFVPGFLSNEVAAHGRASSDERTRLEGVHPSDSAAVTAGMNEWTKANPAPSATLAQTANHIDHIRQVAGIDHIGLGGDFDGITSVPVGLEDVSKYPDLTAELLRRGYKDDEVKKVLGLNVLRVRQCCWGQAGVTRRMRTDLESDRAMPQSAGETVIVAFGDSTTAGTPAFLSPIEAPPSGRGDERSQYAYWLMQTHPDWRVLNRGVNGERSDQVRARFERDVLDAVPRAVIIIAGVNDVYQGRPAAHVQKQLQAMYSGARAARIPVVAGSILPYNTATSDQNGRMRAINAWISVQADTDPNITFVDTRAAVAAPEQPDVLVSSPDRLHPSIDGYSRMADALRPALERVLARGRSG
ncbi:MAG: membrane dipeptidase [Acidobacteria bacterium]|nr:membrane dipeptidase [Acidobacteriota bacterium]